MMDENKGDRAAIDLSAGATMAVFRIRGVDYEVEVFEAMDDLAALDGKHENDVHHCRACGKDFIIPREVYYTKGMDYRCPKEDCPSNKPNEDGSLPPPSVIWNKSLTNDVAEYIRTRYGVPTCGRMEAAAFYDKVVETCRAVKKNAG